MAEQHDTRAHLDAIARVADATAAMTPTPGGGTIGPAVGALGAALASMAVAYSLGKRSLAEHQPELERAAVKLARSREMLLELAAEDAQAYTALNDAMRLPKDNPARAEAVAAAATDAAAAPAAVVATCANLLRLLADLPPRTNRYLHSDLAIAAILAEACARAAAWNVRVNLPLLANDADRAKAETQTEQSLAISQELAQRIEHACAS